MPSVSLGPPANIPSAPAPEAPLLQEGVAPPYPAAESSADTFDGEALAELGNELREATHEYRAQKEAVDRAQTEDNEEEIENKRKAASQNNEMDDLLSRTLERQVKTASE